MISMGTCTTSGESGGVDSGQICLQYFHKRNANRLTTHHALSHKSIHSRQRLVKCFAYNVTLLDI